MKWYNEPPNWQIVGDTIQVTCDRNTDFWRKTEYGFISDNGHFYYETVTGDFCAEVNVKGEYKEQYDQAGLMVRLNEAHWLKCGVEFIDGIQNFMTVVTQDYSDVSIIPLSPDSPLLKMRLLRRGEVLEVSYSLEKDNYTAFRMTHFTSAMSADVGIMCASPTEGCFSTVFQGFKITSDPSISKKEII